MKKVVVARAHALLTAGLVMLALLEARAVVPLTPPPGTAMPVTLAWNPVSDPVVSGYALYYGLTNQPATNRVDAGANTVTTVFNLRAGVGYRFYAVSYDGTGLESLPSNELLLTPPMISSLQLSRKSDGSMQLKGKAAPGTACSVLFTPTLSPPAWQTLLVTNADQVGNLIALDSSARQAKSRFYRVALGALPLLGALQIHRQPDGNVLLSGKAPPGASCRVQYASTPNATLWLSLKTAAADSDGNVRAVDTTAREAPRRFYRMAMP